MECRVYNKYDMNSSYRIISCVPEMTISFRTWLTRYQDNSFMINMSQIGEELLSKILILKCLKKYYLKM